MKKRKLDFTKDMPLRERRKIQNKRCSKCKHGIVLMEYEGEIVFTCKRYYNYWHYIREGMCKEFKKEGIKSQLLF